METTDRKYFERKRNYNVSEQDFYFSCYEEEALYIASRIRNVSRDALSGGVSPTEARKEIRGLIRVINKMKNGE